MLQWMGDKGGYELSAEDIADQLELTSRVHGVKEVEMYFDAIPYNLRGYEVYCALLNAYALHRSLGKAEATMQKIRELGLVRDALPYNLMLNLYSKTREECAGYAADGIYNLVEEMGEEMEEEGIYYDEITYNILLKFYGDNVSIGRMKKLFTELEADPFVNTDWYHYFLAAQGYWYARQIEKSLTMLKKSEESREGNLNEVYLSMICYLSKKNDIDGAEMIWEEWFSNKKEMDFRIPIAMIVAYGSERQWKKAEAIVFRMTESGIEPDANTLHYLAYVYDDSNQVDKALETSVNAFLVSKTGWKPAELHTIDDCFEYLERLGNELAAKEDDAREELYKMLKDHCGLPTWLCDCLKNLPISQLRKLSTQVSLLTSSNVGVNEREEQLALV